VVPALITCGGQTRDEKPAAQRCEVEPWACDSYDDQFWDDDDGFGYYDGDPYNYDDDYVPNQQDNTGGTGAIEEQTGGMAGANEIIEPTPSTQGYFRMQGAGMLVEAGDSGPLTYYSVIAQPQDTLVEASLDGIAIRTGATGGATFLLDECVAREDGTEECRLTIHTFSASASGSPGVDAPFDGRFGSCSGTGAIVSVVRTNDSWSIHLESTEMTAALTRWEGPVVAERYEDGELDFLQIEQEIRHEYLLPVAEFEASCTWDACAVTIVAGSQ